MKKETPKNRKRIKKVLILGSGALKIGEAGEFDYSGSQAIKALKEEKVKTILVNPNIATIQTSENFADKVYFLPVNPNFVEKIIEKEKPDGILLSFGGQTALNCGVSLYKKGILKKHNVEVLGTPVQSIIDTEDRELFIKKLEELKLLTPKSIACRNINEAKEAENNIGYPMIIRPSYTLGGQGSGIAQNKKEFDEIIKMAFSYSPLVLVEEYLGGWKEVEYEIVRDSKNNCIAVCNMENFDPLGIHTGESIVVAPSQTLTNKEYHMLREISIKAIRHIGIIGECNIQFALDPSSMDYRIIEVNARLSRSSALASKATGYPLAYIAAKLALGYSLIELSNSVTKETKACFEPALDYVVVKIPRWDLQKFSMASRYIASSMKSVGEVMAIGRKFEEALQKAIRMTGNLTSVTIDESKLEDYIRRGTDQRIMYIFHALRKKVTVDKIHEWSRIDKWFLYKMQNIVDIEEEVSKSDLTKDNLLKAKKYGFSDRQISDIKEMKEEDVRSLRYRLGIRPFAKQIDTLAAEYPAKTNYLYLTYNGTEDDVDFKDRPVITLGSGSYSIGSSVEFDWCSVNCVMTLKELGYKTTVVNFNPETVSTDYDMCDRLYFEELSFEVVYEIYQKENPKGIILSMGGQLPNNLALKCQKENIRVLGTSPSMIDIAENRHKFSKLCDDLDIMQPEWRELKNLSEAKEFSRKVGYPVIIRPSYVLSGASMNIAYNEDELEEFLKKAAHVSKEHPVVISKFITNAREIEIDAVSDNGKLIEHAISEHIEHAGVHSGDATIVFPAQKTYYDTIKKIIVATKKISEALKITGPFNIQFLAKDQEIKVIECNLRASRSFPFISKVSKVNLIRKATKAICSVRQKENELSQWNINYVGVKSPQFSFSKISGADPILKIEMASTGEVACFGETMKEAFLKSLVATGIRMPKKNVLVSVSGDEARYKMLESIRKLKNENFNLYATENTSDFLHAHGIENTKLYKIHSEKKPNVIDYLNGEIDFVINIPKEFSNIEMTDGYKIRRSTADLGIPLMTNIQITKLFIETLLEYRKKGLGVKSWDEYV